MIRRMMYATDFSPASVAAFTTAVELAQATHAHLVIAHVLAPAAMIVGEGLYISPDTWEKIESGARSAAQEQIDGLVRTAKDAGLEATGLIAQGVPAEQIVDTASAQEIDLLVLGTHGRTGLSKVFLGSVATRVVATAACPVLTVRAK